MKDTYIIAEIGVNHNGELAIAKKMIDAAKEAGANAVKFQTYKTEFLVAPDTVKAPYQEKNTGDNLETQFDMLKKLELDKRTHSELKAYSISKKIDFISTPFDLDSADFLINELQVPLIKISSGEIVNGPLLLKVALSGLPIILSTGMATEDEISQALSIIAHGLSNKIGKPDFNKELDENALSLIKEKVTILLCTTAYPTPVDDINLLAMKRIESLFNTKVGISDHSDGITISLAAVACGACVVEKHITLNRNMPGPDHAASLEPHEFKRLVDEIRIVERAMGKPVKQANNSEKINLSIARQSLIAAKKIKVGENFSEENLSSRRPGTGLSPMNFWSLIGRTALRDYNKGDIIIDE
jgi:N-acetylneuraminate synthase